MIDRFKLSCSSSAHICLTRAHAVYENELIHISCSHVDKREEIKINYVDYDEFDQRF